MINRIIQTIVIATSSSKNSFIVVLSLFINILYTYQNITGSFSQIYVMLLPVYFFWFTHSLIQVLIYQQSLL